MLKIIDKAAWQIDGGIPEVFVVKHFKTLFEWLNQHDMLSEEGKEELFDGIDNCASLNENLVTPDALIFWEMCYDEYLKALEDGKYRANYSKRQGSS
ncbi:MAG: hypothetical protein FWH17_05715 [Oscillospiraceae bacterium]|nr:hypothetical protein [Oscillospiraceae bacterium]